MQTKQTAGEGTAAAIDPGLQEKLSRVRLFLCDVDGVLTDGGVFIGAEEEVKRFNIQDGLGLRLLQRCGIKVGWVSNRNSSATTKRAQELKVDYLFQGEGSKVQAVEAILQQAGAGWEDICFVGDDMVDLGAMRRAGLAVSVANGIEDARTRADYVTRAQGGHGAVREIVQMILQAQGKWESVVETYLSQ